MVIAFDVDGTLIDVDNNPRLEVIALLKALDQPENTIIVFSGGGADYARMWVERLALGRFVHLTAHKAEAGLPEIDLAIDDGEVKLGKLNLRV